MHAAHAPANRLRANEVVPKKNVSLTECFVVVPR